MSRPGVDPGTPSPRPELRPVHGGQPEQQFDRRPGLYVHVPFCSAICPYCDFAVVRASHQTRSSYVPTLLAEARHIVEHEDSGAQWEPFGTVYLGGGTPSALDDDELASLCQGLAQVLPVANNAHWSLEINPEDVTEGRVRAWCDLGFSYFSLGVQALDDPSLEFLGRRHSATQALEACRQVVEGVASSRSCGVVSVDLIYGFEGLTVDQWRSSLHTAAGLGVGHMSCYELTIHEGTPFHRWQLSGRLVLPRDEVREELFRATVEGLAQEGFSLYEVSNFSRSESEQSPHNRKYWDSIPYLGLGPSAHSFDGSSRWWNQRDPGAWSRSLANGESVVAERELLSPEQLRLEWLMTRMRTALGGDLLQFRERFGVDLMERRGQAVSGLIARGLVKLHESRLHPTITGLALADSVVLELAF